MNQYETMSNDELYNNVQHVLTKLCKHLTGEIDMSTQDVEASTAIINKFIPDLESVSLNEVVKDE